MNTKRFWSTCWSFVFPVLLTAISDILLPNTPVLQLLLLPMWVVYRLLVYPSRQTLPLAIWCAILCESTWQIAPGTCILFFLFLWWCVRYFRKILPLRPMPYHGLLCGVILLPVLHLWIWFYAVLWPGIPIASPLLPTLASFILLPAIGALGGSAVFALAQQTEFLIFMPNWQEMREDER